MTHARQTLASWLRRLAERLDPTPLPPAPAERQWVMLGGANLEDDLPASGIAAASDPRIQDFWYTTTTGVD